MLSEHEKLSYMLGLKPWEFWRLTISEFISMTEAYIENKKSERQGADYRTALICCVMANINRDPKKRKKPFEPSDFMPKEQKPKQKQTPEQMFNAVKMLNKAFGGEGG